MDKKYIYFVSYSYQKGFGSSEIFRDKKITSYKDVKEVSEVICEANNIKDVIIINYIQLEN